jgi:glycosyltransferase involved in cell wall biosynthesis
MKICLFTDTLGDLNGVSRFIQDMGEQAYKNNVELHIVTSTKKDIPKTSYIHNLPFNFRVPMPFYQELDLVYPLKRAIKEILHKLRPDVVHISTPGPFGWAAKNIAQSMQLPLIGTYHTDFPAYLYDLTKSKWIKRQTDKVMNKFYQPFLHVISRSDHYIDVMEQELKIEKARTSVLPPGTNLDRFHPKHHNPKIWKQFNLDNGRLKVLYVGRINIEKNIPFLIKTWQEFINGSSSINADLVMIGEGRYQKWAQRIEQDHAYFLGPVVGQALAELYATSDLFIFPSTTDTLGQVVMEAQASGKNCLVSDQGGPQSLIPEGCGKVIKANDQAAWIKALESALLNIETLSLRSEDNRSHMLQYNIEHSFDHFYKIHKNFLKNSCQQDSDNAR